MNILDYVGLGIFCFICYSAHKIITSKLKKRALQLESEILDKEMERRQIEISHTVEMLRKSYNHEREMFKMKQQEVECVLQKISEIAGEPVKEKEKFPETLEGQLQWYLDREEYEKAKEIQEKINKRNK